MRGCRRSAGRRRHLDHHPRLPPSAGPEASARSSSCFGFSLGVGVMVVLLSVGEAMLDQSRDVALVGGGEVTVLPQGIDVEAMRTGGLSGMFFGIDRARFLTRQVLGGPRTTASCERSHRRSRESCSICADEGRRRPSPCGPAARSRAAPPRVGAGLDVREGGLGATLRPIRPTWPPRRSSSTTSWTAFIFRRGRIRPGANGTISTW